MLWTELFSSRSRINMLIDQFATKLQVPLWSRRLTVSVSSHWDGSNMPSDMQFSAPKSYQTLFWNMGIDGKSQLGENIKNSFFRWIDIGTSSTTSLIIFSYFTQLISVNYRFWESTENFITKIDLPPSWKESTLKKCS